MNSSFQSPSLWDTEAPLLSTNNNKLIQELFSLQVSPLFLSLFRCIHTHCGAAVEQRSEMAVQRGELHLINIIEPIVWRCYFFLCVGSVTPPGDLTGCHCMKKTPMAKKLS